MKKNISNIITLAVLILIGSCVSEERFEWTNTTKTSISPASLAQDYNFGVRFSNLNRYVALNGQTVHALNMEERGSDSFLNHSGTPSDLQGGNRDLMSYWLIELWNETPWVHFYDNVVSVAHANKTLATEANLPLFAAWAELFKIMALSRMTLYYGPVIYSEYGEPKAQFDYDSEPELYEQFFANLDEIQGVFQNKLDEKSKELAKFDQIYAGDLAKWLKYINSLRLQLAMRIVKADPAWARREYDKAMSYNDKVGFILTNADNLNSPTQGSWYPLFQISESWGDTRLGAGLEEVMVPYKDPRIHVWFNEVDPADRARLGLADRDPGWAYKGIRHGGWINNGKDERVPYSKVSAYFDHRASGFGGGGTFRRVITAAQVHFTFAEASLRGWSTPGGKSTKDWYEDGIRMSWADWSAGHTRMAGYDVEAYINNDISMPMNYVDPMDAANNYTTKMTDPDVYTIKWKDGISDEKKLERIMTQKWIASFQHSHEMWSDYRRTGYPKIADPGKNMSTATWGIIENGDYLKRYVFVQQERESNAGGVAEATKKLGGPNLISTRLWIHPAGSNF